MAKAADKYLAVNEHTQKLQLVSGGIDESTVLEMIDLDNNKMALKSVYGKLNKIMEDGGSDVNVNRPIPRPWEISAIFHTSLLQYYSFHIPFTSNLQPNEVQAGGQRGER